ncbi:rust resistance kinase Lr10-like [Tasmannia lanceolata]|uniref:rust resistance kinase Lr10-like n=1 Tax=Tasmannia lanceolata TaxID=3420 RepID=UPI0040634FD4
MSSWSSDGVGTTVFVVSGIVGLMILIAIAFAVSDCLKKAAAAIPANFHANPGMVMNPFPADYMVLSEIEAGTIERFIKDMAREKPIRFTPQQLAYFTSNYSIKLGSGGFGQVYKGEIPDRVLVAVKVLNRSLDKRVEEQFMAEVSTIGRTYHLNLVRLYGFCFNATTKALVYEYMDNGSLDKFLFSKARKIAWEKLYEIAIGTARGIAYLHEECQQRIIHYDIKPGNVLLDANYNPKVADFGLAKLCDRENTHVTMTGGRGTPGYAAPELWMPFPITHKCDVYSFGMLLFEIVGRRKNLDVNMTESQEWFPRLIWEKFEKGELSGLVADCGIEEKDWEKAEKMSMVALWCVQYSPDARPTMSSVVKILEGGAEIVTPPPNPFQHMVSNKGSVVLRDSNTNSTATGGTAEVSDSVATGGTADISDSIATGGTAAICCKDSTPIMKMYEIEMASSS